jgi:hypothetical protein
VSFWRVGNHGVAVKRVGIKGVGIEGVCIEAVDVVIWLSERHLLT